MEKNTLNAILVIITIIVAGAFIWTVKGLNTSPVTEIDTPVTTPSETEKTPDTEDEKLTTQFINVFFIGQNKNKEEVYKAVKRKYDPDVDGAAIKLALTSLFDGPTPEEVKYGVYSEIPVGTKLLNLIDAQDGIYINVSRDFELGGGSDSIYKRIFQLIKTAKHNTNKPVYLLIEGNKVEVLGGDGVMISQPLSEEAVGE